MSMKHTIALISVVFAASLGLARAADVPGADHRFVKQATEASAAQVAEARIALKNSTRPDVRDLARRIIAEHTEASDQLNRMALAQGIPIANAPNAADQRKIAELSTLSGDEFDKAYLDNAMADHIGTMKLFSQELEEGKIPQLRSFAKAALPKLRDSRRIVETLPKH